MNNGGRFLLPGLQLTIDPDAQRDGKKQGYCCRNNMPPENVFVCVGAGEPGDRENGDDDFVMRGMAALIRPKLARQSRFAVYTSLSPFGFGSWSHALTGTIEQ